MADTTHLRMAGRDFRISRPGPVGLVVEGLVDAGHPGDYLHDALLSAQHREAFYALVDAEGVVICKGVDTTHATYRGVRGRSTPGRLSPGEYYHHDGCSSPQRPRIVEIRCPHQDVQRYTRTACAPFPQTVVCMFEALPQALREHEEFEAWRGRLDGGELERDEWDRLQGVITRRVRRELGAERARVYFAAVDRAVGAYVEPWEWGESRFVANENSGRTFQHRRAVGTLQPGRPNGSLVKRWPAEELDAPV